MSTTPIAEKPIKCLRLTRPINSIIQQIIPSIAAVEKFAGRISRQTIIIGMAKGRNVLFKSLISFCLTDNSLATYIINASLAKSDVCMVTPKPGISSQRAAWFMFVPKSSVTKSNGIAMYSRRGAKGE